MSRPGHAAAPDGDAASPDGSGWTCEYCGRRFAPASRSGEAYDLLVAHIRTDCPDVPPPVRSRYRARCAGGRCGP